MKINLKKMKWTFVSVFVFLFILANTIIIYKIDKVDRTVLITDPIITQKGTLKETLKTEGETEPSELLKIFYEERKGSLDEVLVEEGQEVQAGTPLLNYSSESNSSVAVSVLEKANERLSAEIDKLNGDITVLQAEIDEYTSLQTEDDIPAEVKQPDLDNTRMINYEIKNIEYEIKMIELQMEENQTKIDMAEKAEEPITIESKIDGIVVHKDEFSRTMDKPILTIMNKSPLLVNVLVSEDQVQRIKVDQEVLIKPKHLDTKIVNGNVIKISDIPYGEKKKTDKSLYKVTIQLEDGEEASAETAEKQLLIGSHVTADITLEELNDVLVLPQNSLAGNQVVVVEKGKLLQKKVTVGLKANEKVAVTKGLNEKQRILPKAESGIKGDTRYITSLNYDAVSKEAYKRFSMKEKLWMLARGIVQ